MASLLLITPTGSTSGSSSSTGVLLPMGGAAVGKPPSAIMSWKYGHNDVLHLRTLLYIGSALKRALFDQYHFHKVQPITLQDFGVFYFCNVCKRVDLGW